MSERKNHGNDWAWWVAALFLLISLYGGAYALLVKRNAHTFGTLIAGPSEYKPDDSVDAFLPEIEAFYSYDPNRNATLEKLFLPANLIDRRIRNGYWDRKEQLFLF